MKFKAYFYIWLSIGMLNVVGSTENDTLTLRGVRGGSALIPCGLNKVFLDGPNSHVTWMKNNREIVYRFPETCKRRSILYYNEQELKYPGARANDDPTSLRLDHLEDSDEGSYRCRVHYQASPTMDFHIEFKVVDAPTQPLIISGHGNEISESVYQLALDTNLTMICEVEHIVPGALVWWERNGQKIKQRVATQEQILSIEVDIKATRDELNARYECFAQNADVTEPLSSMVEINMDLPPVSVEIRYNKKLHFEAGEPRVVDCVVVGSIPPPSITWHLNGVTLTPTIHKEIHDGNFTVSSLTLVPFLKDDQHELICRAHNAHLRGMVFEDKTILNVGFIPSCVSEQEVVVEYVRGTKANVTCVVEAHPAPLQFRWTLASSTVYYTNTQRISKSGNQYSSSLVWPPLMKEEGKMLCRAINMVGDQTRQCPFVLVSSEEAPPVLPECQLIHANKKEIKISCKKSCKKGYTQTIHLELQICENTVHNTTDKNGNFLIQQNWWGTNLTAMVYSSNHKGRSNVRFISVTMNDTDETNQQKKSKVYIWMALIIGTIVLGTFIGIFARCVKFFQDGKGLPQRPQEIVEDDPEICVRPDGSLQKMPELLPSGPIIPVNHVTIRLTSDNKRYVLAPRRGDRVIGYPTVAPIEEEDNFPDVVPEEKYNKYYV